MIKGCLIQRSPVPVGNLRSEILVVQSAQNRHRQRETDSLDGTRDRRVLVSAIGASEPRCNIFGRN